MELPFPGPTMPKFVIEREIAGISNLSDAELSTLRRLEAQGTVVTAQDVPGATAIPLRELR